MSASRPSLSLGIAYSGGLATTADDLLAQADSAMYRAKIEERGAWHVFDPTMRNSAAAQLALRNDLADALAEEQFVLHYQPIVRLADRSWSGTRRCLRWQHPRRGLLMPGDFLDVILDSEYESPITDWVLQRACFDASQLTRRPPAGVGQRQLAADRPPGPAARRTALPDRVSGWTRRTWSWS